MKEEIAGRASNVGDLFQWKGVGKETPEEMQHLEDCIAFCPSAFMLEYDVEKYGPNPGGRGICFHVFHETKDPRDQKVAVCCIGDYIYKDQTGGFHLMTKEESGGKVVM